MMKVAIDVIVESGGVRAFTRFPAADIAWVPLDASHDVSDLKFGAPVSIDVTADGWSYHWRAPVDAPEDLLPRIWWAVRTWWQEREERKAERSMSR